MTGWSFKNRSGFNRHRVSEAKTEKAIFINTAHEKHCSYPIHGPW